MSARAASRWRPYPAYADSGVEWIGDIPAHWEAIRLKMLSQVKRGASPRPIDDPIYFDDDGEYSWVRISDVTASDRYLLSTEQRLSDLGKSKSVPLEPGEIFLSIAASVGKPIITKIKCCIHDGFVYFSGLKMEREFLFYILSGGELYKGLGKLGTQLNLNTETVGGIRVPVPPLSEQHAIAAFLDRETAKIDALIAKMQRLIDLLDERRAALISHAVTRGLDPSVPMRDSGIAWLGDIPSHWDIVQVGKICRSIVPGRDKPKQFDGDIPWVTMPDIHGNLYVNESRSNLGVSVKTVQEAHTKIVPEQSVLMSCVGEFGITAITARDIVINQQLHAFVCPQELMPYFLAHVLQTQKSFMEVLATTTTIPYLNKDKCNSLPIPLPPIEDQELIVDYLKMQTGKMGGLINQIYEAIEKLQEYRTALISAAVTGKIDVREEV